MSEKCPKCNHPLDSHGRCSFCGNVSRRPGKIFLAIGLVVLALVLVAGVGFGWRQARSSIENAILRFLAEKDGEVHIAPPSGKIIGTAKPTFSVDELKRFRKLLKQGEFDTLNGIASMIQANFENNPGYEYHAHDFFFCFKSILPEDEQLFDAWIKHSPDHFAPYLARARFFYDQGWAQRGTKFANETTSEQFHGMHVSFLQAGKDIDVALALNPRLLTGHIMRLFIANADGENPEENRLIEQTSALFPTSFLMYQAILQTKLPRWGGSYAEMNAIATHAFGHIKENTELYMLFGMIFADQAWAFRKAKEYDKALALYSKALLYGEHYSFFMDRAWTYYFQGDYYQALEDINRSIELRPSIIPPYSLRGLIYAAMGREEKALADFTLAEELSPGDPDILSNKRCAAARFIQEGHTVATTNPREAISSYDKALRIDPLSGRAYTLKGLAYVQLTQFDLAVPQFRRAIELDPRDIRAVKAMDYTLMTQGRWDEIIGYWNNFLALEPDNGDAYLERAGTFHHKGDEEHALTDLKKACDLGEQKACSLFQRQEWK